MIQRLFLALCFAFPSAWAQVGIGTTSPSAALDVPASNAAAPSNKDGVLVPRINAFPATAPTAAQHGMLVFLTATVGTNNPGFYYWNQPTTSWIGVGATLTNNWNLLGNAGTVPATNFLGTTDNQDIAFRRNNIRAAFIGNPDVAAGNKNTSFGANALNAATTGTRNTAIGTNVMPTNGIGAMNTAVGDQAMFSNNGGAENSAFGVGALYSNTSGASNTALGRNALTSNVGGASNTAVGYTALRTNNGDFNTAVGRDALRTNGSGSNNSAIGVNAAYAVSSGANNTAAGVQSLRLNATGGNNTAVGMQSLYSAAGSGNVGIGYQAGYNETGSNRLYIENSQADATTALVYGEFDNKILRTNGQLQVGNPAATGYKFPTARGTNKQTLETDAAGNVSWVTPNSYLSVMRVRMSANQSLTTGGWQKMTFDTTTFDTNTEFVAATNRFVAAKAGYYRVNAGYHIFGLTTTQYFSIAVYVNGLEVQETSANHNYGPVARNISLIVQLNAGDYVEIWAQNYETGATVDSYAGKTFFEIEQIR